MNKLELIKINKAKQYCINLQQLKELGYDYPEKGTIVYVPWIFDFLFRKPEDFIFERFYESSEKSNDFVWVSMFGTHVGKRLISNNECYITIEEMSKLIIKKQIEKI